MVLQQLNPIACKTYLLKKEEQTDIILIDPVITYVPDYMSMIEQNNWHLTYVIDTHTHADHISGGRLLKDLTGCNYIMHHNAPAQCVTIRIKDSDVLVLNDITVTFYETFGHTMDSISLVVENALLTGDALFLDQGGAARDDLPGGDPIAHWKTLQFYKNLPDSLIVFPAHEYHERKPSSLKVQKESNPHLKAKSEVEFIQYLDQLQLGAAEWMKDVLKANYKCANDANAAWIPKDNTACEIKGQSENEEAGMHAPHITPVEFLHQQNLTSSVILDVREPSELEEDLGAIDGLLNIPLGSLPTRIQELDSMKEKEIIVVCRSGARAEVAAGFMVKSGFKNVKVLKGGMIAYQQTIKEKK